MERYPNLTPFQVKTILYAIAKSNQQKSAAATAARDTADKA